MIILSSFALSWNNAITRDVSWIKSFLTYQILIMSRSSDSPRYLFSSGRWLVWLYDFLYMLRYCYIGELMGFFTLRAYKSACQLPDKWTAEPFTSQRDRVLALLVKSSPLSASTFACCFALLTRLLESSSGLSDSLRLSILDVFESHALLRSDKETVQPSTTHFSVSRVVSDHCKSYSIS